MIQTVRLKPTGTINRREKPDDIDDDQVISRENLFVVGAKNKYILKHPGSDRLNSSAVGAYAITHAFRYYSKLNFRKTFFFGGGSLYAIDDLGNTTSLIATLNPTAFPVSEIMRVSASDIQYFSDGYNGMYSYDGNPNPTFVKEASVTLNPVCMISWLDRMWVFEEDSDDLHFSVNQQPTNFTDSTDAGIITVAPKRGSKLICLAILNETLFIFKQDGIFYVEGRSPEQFGIRECVSWLGCAARKSIQNVETGLIFLGSDYEFYSFQGNIASLKMLTYNLAMSGDFTKNLQPLINKDRMTQVNSVYHNKIYRCAYNSFDSTDIFNDMEYCFNTINETDFLTRGNNVGCYVKYDKNPDQQQLLTGRSDTGFVMNQYRGLNWDNQATGASMSILTQTKFEGLDRPQNLRLRRFWLNMIVLSPQPINIYYFLDGRIAYANATSESFVTLGEERSLGFANIKTVSQNFITSRQIPKHDYSNGQSISFAINDNTIDREFAFSSIDMEVLTDNYKRSEKVGT